MATQRPTLTADPQWLREARGAVDRFVAGLQDGIDSANAQTYNADYGEDVMWGSPYGATVLGYDALHAIHRRMFDRGVAVAGASSRYQTAHVMAPTPDVAIAHDNGSRWTTTANRSRSVTRLRSRRWRCTCWYGGTGNGGLLRARTPPFVRSHDRGAGWQVFARVGQAPTFS